MAKTKTSERVIYAVGVVENHTFTGLLDGVFYADEKTPRRIADRKNRKNAYDPYNFYDIRVFTLKEKGD